MTNPHPRLIVRVHFKLRAGELQVPPLRFVESNSFHALGFHRSVKSEGKKLVTDRVPKILYCQISPLKNIYHFITITLSK